MLAVAEPILRQGAQVRRAARPDDGGHAFVVPAYGRSPFLDGCLRSLDAQTRGSRAVITTSTPSRFIDRVARARGVPVIVNPVRAGIAADWNFALEATGARYVTLAHQDDVYAPDFLARTLSAFARHGGSLCFTGQRQVDDGGRPCASRVSRVKRLLAAATLGGGARPSRRRMRAFLALGNPLPCSSVTLDRHRLPGFRFSGGFDSNLDWDAWLRLVERGEPFLSVPEPLVGRRHNAMTATARLIADGRRRTEDRILFRRIWPRPVADAVAALYTLGY